MSIIQHIVFVSVVITAAFSVSAIGIALNSWQCVAVGVLLLLCGQSLYTDVRRRWDEAKVGAVRMGELHALPDHAADTI